MTILVTADLHLGDKLRDQYRHDFMEQLPALAKECKADAVLILGDLTEEKNRHDAWLVNAVTRHIDRLAAATADVVILRGNHDYVDENIPFYEFLRRLPNVTWVNEPFFRDNMLFLPHTTNWDRDYGRLKYPRNLDWLLAHNTFEGADAGHGRRIGDIPLSVLPDCRVISGDVHTPQQLGCVTYVGAPYTVDFGDDYNPRLLLIKDDGTLKSIPCTGPQKRLVNMTLDSVPPKTPTRGVLTDCLSLESRALNKGDIVKAQVSLSARHYQYWPQVRQMVRDWAQAHELVLHQVRPIVDKGPLTTAQRTVTKRTDAQLIDEYVSAKKVDGTTAKAGHRLARSA